MTTFAQLAELGDRLEEVVGLLCPLQADMKPHAVYSPEHMAAAVASLHKARTGLAQSIGYAVMSERRDAREKAKKKPRP